MAWTLTPDVETWLGRAGDFLRERAAENTVPLTVAETLRAMGQDSIGGGGALFGWWAEADGSVAGAFMNTPPYGVALSPMALAAAGDLAGVLIKAGRDIPSVFGRPESARAFAAQWSARTGCGTELRRSSRLFVLGTLVPPSPPPAGAARVASAADTGVLRDWLRAFHQEADASAPASVEAGIMADRLRYGGFTLWETGGEPVSLAGTSRPAAGQVRIGPVYTPPRWRGRGFGGAVTAAVSQAALAAGTPTVVLYTDQSNPTSNALYQRLGFQPVSDQVLIGFGPDPGESGR
jgi:RimJ/RimL family protein N-acetyltransferase